MSPLWRKRKNVDLSNERLGCEHSAQQGTGGAARWLEHRDADRLSARERGCRFDNDFAARRGWGRLGRFTGVGGVCDQLSGWLAQQEINTKGVFSRVRAGNAHQAPFFRQLNNQPSSTLRHLPLAP